MAEDIQGIPIIFGDRRQPKALPLSHPKARWQGFKTEKVILPKGYRRRPGSLSLPCDILLERDTPVQLRDGTRIYIDIYRPSEQTNPVPAVLAWSPYGKYGGKGNQVLDDFPFRMGVPLRKLSELQKWEGPDPAYWVQHGYAVVNADPRGVGKSEGNIYQFGTQEGRDGADVIDWIGEQEWCSGKVALSGNSWLSISSWFIAAERPKHLAAISPWEGLTDLYREGSPGGVLSVPAMNFSLQLLQVNAGENSWENTVEMASKYLLHNAYHEDKAAKIENIEVPAYVVASWSNPIHTYGTFRGYSRLTSDKWLRVHDSWEWPDYYDEANRADLHKFFDYFLKGIKNGWEMTPRVRVKILDTGNPLPLTGRTLTSATFPSSKMISRRLFINGEGTMLSETPTPKPSTCSYKAQTGQLMMKYIFSRDTTLCGPVRVRLSLSLQDGNDSDIFIVVKKILASGRPGSQLKIPYDKAWQSCLIRAAKWTGLIPALGFLFYHGPSGQIRVSRREVCSKNSVPGFPVSDYRQSNPVSQGQVVHVDVPMTPIGMFFAAGEAFQITLQGVDPAIYPPVDQASLIAEGIEEINKDVSVNIHSNGSFVELPIVDS